jgi:hypothetical protein
MGCVNSKLFSIEEEPISDVPLRTQPLATVQKHTKDSLWDLVNDGEFQAQVTERAFQIFLHEDLPHYWKLQFDLLVVLKFIFDRVKPRRASVIFPNRPLRYPTGDTEAFLKLTSIETLHEGFRVWIEYLVQTGSLRPEQSDWQTAFQQTREGNQFSLFHAEGSVRRQNTEMPLQELCASQDRRSATEEMTRTIEDAYNDYSSAQESSTASGLHQDMCCLSGPGVLRSEIDDGTVASSLPPELQYACRYWISHLTQAQQDMVDGDTTHLFLQKHLLHWLEAMGLMRKSSRCVHLLDNLQALAGVSSSQNIFLSLC